MVLHAVGGSTEQIATENDLEEADGSDLGLKVILSLILAAFVWQFVRSALPLMFSGGLFIPLIGVGLLMVPAMVLVGVFTHLWKSRHDVDEQPLATVKDITAAVPPERADTDAQDLAA